MNESNRGNTPTTQPHGRQQYQAYLLRVWSEPGNDGRCIRRFSLERVGSGQRQGFANFDALVAYLESNCQQADTSATNIKL